MTRECHYGLKAPNSLQTKTKNELPYAMNEQLKNAERGLMVLLRTHRDGVSMKDILENLDSTSEADLRAAVWTLNAKGEVEFVDGRLKEAQPA